MIYITGPDGTGTHGPNSVISMLHHSMFRRGFGEKGCVLHADNAGGKLIFIYCVNLLSSFLCL
jgi:hypothetical protein